MHKACLFFSFTGFHKIFIPKGDEDLVNEFYSLEDYLEYPVPQIINENK